MSQYSMSIIKTEEEWNLIQQEWTVLLERSEHKHVFLTYAWIRTWWSFWGKGSLSIAIVRKDNAVICIIPLVLNRRFFFRVLGFIGTKDTDYSGIILDKGIDRHDVWVFFLQNIGRHIKWDALDLFNLEDDERKGVLAVINEIQKKRKHSVVSREMTKCIPDINHDQDVMSHINAKMLRTMKSRTRGPIKDGSLLFEEYLEIDEKMLQDFFNMHIKRWNKKRIKSNFLQDKYKTYFSELSLVLAAEKVLYVAVMRMKGEVIAFAYCFRYEGTLSIYLTIYDLNQGHLCPGHCLISNIIQANKYQDIKELDFLRGDEPYKYKWTPFHRSIYRLLIGNTTMKGSLYVILVNLFFHMKSSMKKIKQKMEKQMEKFHKRNTSILS